MANPLRLLWNGAKTRYANSHMWQDIKTKYASSHVWHDIRTASRREAAKRIGAGAFAALPSFVAAGSLFPQNVTLSLGPVPVPVSTVVPFVAAGAAGLAGLVSPRAGATIGAAASVVDSYFIGKQQGAQGKDGEPQIQIQEVVKYLPGEAFLPAEVGSEMYVPTNATVFENLAHLVNQNGSGLDVAKTNLTFEIGNDSIAQLSGVFVYQDGRSINFNYSFRNAENSRDAFAVANGKVNGKGTHVVFEPRLQNLTLERILSSDEFNALGQLGHNLTGAKLSISVADNGTLIYKVNDQEISREKAVTLFDFAEDGQIGNGYFEANVLKPLELASKAIVEVRAQAQEMLDAKYHAGFLAGALEAGPANYSAGQGAANISNEHTLDSFLLGHGATNATLSGMNLSQKWAYALVLGGQEAAPGKFKEGQDNLTAQVRGYAQQMFSNAQVNWSNMTYAQVLNHVYTLTFAGGQANMSALDKQTTRNLLISMFGLTTDQLADKTTLDEIVKTGMEAYGNHSYDLGLQNYRAVQWMSGITADALSGMGPDSRTSAIYDWVQNAQVNPQLNYTFAMINNSNMNESAKLQLFGDANITSANYIRAAVNAGDTVYVMNTTGNKSFVQRLTGGIAADDGVVVGDGEFSRIMQYVGKGE